MQEWSIVSQGVIYLKCLWTIEAQHVACIEGEISRVSASGLKIKI